MKRGADHDGTKECGRVKKENAWLQECQRAARLWEKIEILQGAADALKRQIAKDQKENETSRRIRDLAYSLKQSWGKRLNEALEKEAAYKEQQDALQERRQQDKQEKSRLEENIRNLHQTKGMLEGKIRDFQKEEPEILEKTGVSLLRNLLGYLEPEEVRDAQNRLQTERNEAEKACGKHGKSRIFVPAGRGTGRGPDGDRPGIQCAGV